MHCHLHCPGCASWLQLGQGSKPQADKQVLRQMESLLLRRLTISVVGVVQKCNIAWPIAKP
jgi:hypothetical protein